jgi:hypothetical protein
VNPKEQFMSIHTTMAAAVAGLALLPLSASAGVIGGTNLMPQYDYGEFFSIADHHDFKVVLAGNPFPGRDMGAVARDLLPAMQAAKPRPALTFAYDVAAEKDQPDYRLVMVFDPADDLSSNQVCRGESRFKPGRPGLFNAYAVYCRNDQVLTEATAWTPASSPSDPRVERLFRELFMVVFPDSDAVRPNVGDGNPH